MSARTRAIPGRRPTCSISVSTGAPVRRRGARSTSMATSAEGATSADEDGLARLVHTLGPDVRGCVEMMSGAVWVRDRLPAAGWADPIAEPRKVKALAPLACKTDRVDARVLAELVRRDLVPELWVPSLSDRELRERLRRRTQLVRLRTSATNRAFGLLTQWGLRVGLTTLRKPGSIKLLSERGVPAVWLESITTLLSVINDLDRQIASIEHELRPLAHDNEHVRLLMTIPGIAELLGLTLLAEIGDITRFPSACRLVGCSRLPPTIKQPGQHSRPSPLSKAVPSTPPPAPF